MKISELTYEQKCHMAWHLDHYTYVGVGTAGRIARGEFGDLDVVDVFKMSNMTDRQSAVHAKQVETFILSKEEREHIDSVREILTAVLQANYEKHPESTVRIEVING